MTAFDEFYKININMPADNAPSFRFRLVDEFGRIGERQYGTIEPAEPGSVLQYEQAFISRQLALYLSERFQGVTDGSKGFVEAKAFLNLGTRLKPLQDFIEGKLGALSIASGMMLIKERPDSRPRLSEIYGFQPDRIHQYVEDICEAVNACRHGFRKDVFVKLVNKWKHMIVDYVEPVGLRARATAYVQNFLDENNLRYDSVTTEGDFEGLTLFVVGNTRIAMSENHVRVKWVSMGTDKTARKESTAYPLLLDALEAELHQQEMREDRGDGAITHELLQEKCAAMMRGLDVTYVRQVVKTDPRLTRQYRITTQSDETFTLTLTDGVFGAYAELLGVQHNTEYLVRWHTEDGFDKFEKSCKALLTRSAE